jgi:L-arabinose transport system substrate-binding protein
MMKRKLFSLLTLAAALSVGGIFSAQDVPLFVAINKSADQQYFIDLQTSFAATVEGFGGTARTFDAKLDPNLGITLVEDAISAGAKGIAITVPDQTIGPAISQLARDAGVVLIATDDSIVDADGNPVPFVGFNGSEMGRKVGEAAVELLTASGWLEDSSKKVGVLSVEVQTLSVCNDRTDAEKAAILTTGISEAQIFPVPYTGEALSAQDAAGPVITANPDITNWVVFGCNDEGVLGTLNALATAGVAPSDIIGVGLGAYEACKFWAAGQESGFKAGLFISGLDVGATAAQVLYDAVVMGIEPPEATFANTSIVTPENYADVMDAISLANCGYVAEEAMSADGALFVAINKSADQQYFIDLQTSFAATVEGFGGTARTFDAKLDPNLGITLVEDAISAGAKGIAITVPDQTIGPAISQLARDAGVVLIATDDSIVDADGNPVPFVGFNGSEMGRKVGEAAVELLTASGWLEDSSKKVGVLSVEVQTLSVCNDRTDAEKAAILTTGISEAQIFPVPYTGEALSAQDAAGPVITANPDITNWVVFGCNDEGVLGTLNALATAGVAPSDIIGVGLGAYEACKFWAAGQESGFKAGLFISGLDVGATAAQVLYDAVVMGIEPPEATFANTSIVTPENYADVMDAISLANCGG